MPITVAFSIEPSDAAGIEYGATRIVGPRQHMVIYDSATDDTTLELELPDDDDLDAARARAEELYRQIREVATLPEAQAVLAGAYRFGLTTDLALVYINDAMDMFEERRDELAVMAAQTACEVAARTAIERLVAGPCADKVPLSPARLNRWSLSDYAGMMLFHTATGRRPWDEPWWANYKAHTERRNNVAHKGASVTRDEAGSSIEAMWAFIEYIREVEAEIMADDG